MSTLANILIYGLLLPLVIVILIVAFRITVSFLWLRMQSTLFSNLIETLTKLDSRYRTLLCGEAVHLRVKWLVPSDIVVISQFGVFGIKVGFEQERMVCTVATYEHYPEEESKPDKVDKLPVESVAPHINKHRSLVMGVKDVDNLQNLLTGGLDLRQSADAYGRW